MSREEQERATQGAIKDAVNQVVDAALQAEYARGHLWSISVTSRGVSTVVGDPTYHQADWEGEPSTLQVRAFSLPAAMEEAARVPVHRWQHFPEDEDGLYGISAVLSDVREECSRAYRKHGDQSHLPDGTGESLVWEDVPLALPMDSTNVRAGQLAEWARCRCEAASENGGDGTITLEMILTEELFEGLEESNPQRLYAELIQISSFAATWAHIVRNRPIEPSEET